MRRKKIGLALGGGAARGMAHVGVLEVLEREGIPVDMIAGTSAGAAVGALYACGKTAAEMVNIALEMEKYRLPRFIDPFLPRSGLIKGRKIKDLITSFLGGDIRFRDLKIPFACVAADIDTGEEVVINHGSVPEAVRASISLPAIFAVVKKNGRHLVDGGLVNPVPVSVVKKMGAEFVIAVNVMPEVADRTRRAGKGMERRKEPGIINVLIQALYINAHSLVRESMAGADIAIAPRLKNLSAGDFRKAHESIRLGSQAAGRAMPQIRKALAFL